MIACIITFIVTLISTVTITFIVIYIFIKNKFVSTEKDTTTNKQQPAPTADTVVYDTVGPPSQTSGKEDLEVINPAYTKSCKMVMSTNPAYETCK